MSMAAYFPFMFWRRFYPLTILSAAAGREKREPGIVGRLVERQPKGVIAYLAATESGNEAVLRKAQLAAQKLGGRFFAVHVGSIRDRLCKRQVRALADDIVLAGVLGAKFVWLESSDPTGELLAFACRARVARILVPRAEPAHTLSMFRSSIHHDLMKRGQGLRIDVVGFERKCPATVTALRPHPVSVVK
jgi:K+-sensing histidine kinase KdpD